jgi:predicted CXXCH cytochrome family protein
MMARLVALLVLALVACGPGDPDGSPRPGAATPAAERGAPSDEEAASYVGAARCAACHAAEAERWHGSHHDRAMEEASEASVLGDFANASFDHFATSSSFSRREGRFVVRTDGPDGALQDHEVAFTFGVFPLQQYLVRFPGGRLQALPLAWDARPPPGETRPGQPARRPTRESADAQRAAGERRRASARPAGGQRWLHLHPEEPVPPGDVLHWTKPAWNWNAQCAECHSTNLRKGWDPRRRSFDTTYAEIDVACEACHGPGARHVAWAETPDGPASRHVAGAGGQTGPAGGARPAGLTVDLGSHGPLRWVFAEGAAIARRERPLPDRTELETCAPCHARRSLLREGRVPGEPFLDTHRPALLEEGLYHADGQMQDEVYVWGSFVQSPMYAAGVSCSDCHDPHSLRLRAEGNTLCGQCHRPEVFDVPGHHRHEAGSPGSACVGCHMPARTYMVVDERHDHSFRVPRPDLSVSLGTPNACTDCHTERSARWAAERVAGWFPEGRAGTPHFAEALHAGRQRLPGAAARLAAVAADAALPAIVRATALDLLGEQPDGAAFGAAVSAGLAGADPLLRLGALEAAELLPPPRRVAAAAPLLGDPLLAVRADAGRLLADAPADLWSARGRAGLADALAEYRAVQSANAERPEAHLALGLLHARLGELFEARREYETAIELAPWFVPAYVNRADLERAAGDDAAAEAWLRRALEAAPESADVHSALGLTLVRRGRREEALAELERAAALAPEVPRHAFVLGVALHELGQTQRALAVLEAARQRHPGDADLQALLEELLRSAGGLPPVTGGGPPRPRRPRRRPERPGARCASPAGT